MQSLAFYALHLFLLSCLFPMYLSSLLISTCNKAMNYTSGSLYDQNLNLTLKWLAANASLTGFYTTSVGQSLDVVYGLVQCRGDVSNNECQVCASEAAIEIKQLCSNQKEAFISYDNCLLRYSASRFFTMVNVVLILELSNIQVADDPVLLNNQLQNLIKNLSSVAAFVPSRFAVGRTSYMGAIMIYSMMQCTRDLAEDSCLSCLQSIIRYSPTTCSGKVGCQRLTMSCNYVYEMYKFYEDPISPPPFEVESPSPSLSHSNSSTNGFNESTSSVGKEKSKKNISFVVVSLAAALVAMSIVCGCLIWKWNRRKRVGHTDGMEDGIHSYMESFFIGLSTLKAATNNFSDANKLGQGGFGPVYKGVFSDGREIAVKRLSIASAQGLEELKTEVTLLAKLAHRNLVRLLGFCIQDEEKLLVYEYLSNGSLDRILFDQGRGFCLEWNERYKIIVGIARGILYLHEDSQLRIVHRDLKTSNILLDDSMNPKISDFGMAKLFNGSQTQGNTNRISGTYGYMAPEYVKSGQFSTKSDVYSFGVIILEILTGRKNSSYENGENLQSYVWRSWSNETALALLDPSLGDQCPSNEVLNCIQIGLLCLQKAPADRPTMSEIVMMLSSHSVTTREPCRPPAFFVPNSCSNSQSELWMGDSPTSYFHHSSPSVNVVTVTDLDAR